MKDLSFFLLKKSLTFKMKKGFTNMCTGDASTSTLNQPESVNQHQQQQQQPTLEEMIMQLDLEEKRPSLQHRMSCVNSCDILRSARHALNQYPRFSLDGKDAMYRSSFRNSDYRNRGSVDRGRGLLHLPAKVAGERVIWCKPGVVGRLMGLEAMPIPIRLKHKMKSCLVRQQVEVEVEVGRRRNHGNSSTVAVKMRDEVGWPMGRFIIP